jgi:hypothetical protein
MTYVMYWRKCQIHTHIIEHHEKSIKITFYKRKDYLPSSNLSFNQERKGVPEPCLTQF